MKRIPKTCLGTLVLGALMLVLAGAAQAATITWTGGSDGTSWLTKANWDLNRIPGAGDDVVIPDLPGTSQVFFTGPPTTLNSFTTAENLIINGHTLSIAAASSTTKNLTIQAGTLTGNGNLTISTAFTFTSGAMAGTGITTVNAGAIWTWGGSTTTNSVLSRTLVNNGTMIRSGTNNLSVNSPGVLRNQSGGTIDLRGDLGIFGTGAIENQAGAVLLKSTGSGVCVIGPSFTNTGTVRVQSGTMNVTGTFTNLASSTLTGGIYDLQGTFRYTGGDIRTSQATIILDGPASLFAKTGGANALSLFNNNGSAGSLTLRNSRNLSLPGDLFNYGNLVIGQDCVLTANGLIQEAGETRLDQGSIVTPEFSGVGIMGGILRGSGTIRGGELRNEGILAPGSSAGSLVIGRDFSQSPEGTLQIELGGQASTQYDNLEIAGVAYLDGNLSVSLIDGFHPVAGNTFDIITAKKNINGAFATDNLPLPSGCLGISYQSNSVKLQDADAAGVTLQPNPHQDICTGSPVTFSATTGGDGISLQWRKNGVAILGATASALSIPSVAAGDAGTYDLVVSNGCNSDTSDAAVLVVSTLAPGIVLNPAGIDICDGDEAIFTVTVTGNSPPALQWRKNGVDVPGATGPSLIIGSAGPADVAGYDVVAKNGCGIATSSVAELTVRLRPSVISQPLGQTVCSGQPAAFTVQATGAPPIAFQWRKNGTPIMGATSATLSIASTTESSAGNYDVIATNACASVTSNPASLMIAVQPSISQHPADKFACPASAVSFQVGAQGTPPLSFQWRKDNVDIAGATGSSLNLPSVVAPDAGNYSVVVTNTCGSVESHPATLTFVTATDLQATAVFQPSMSGSGLAIDVAWTVSNTGSVAVPAPWTERVLLSTDTELGGDTQLAQITSTGLLAPGESLNRVIPVTIPDDISGDFRILVQVDAGNQVTECSGESNNVTVSPVTLHVTLSPQPDLQVSDVNAPPTATGGQTIQINWVVSNDGDAATSAPLWYDRVVLSIDQSVSSDDINLGKFTNATYLPAGEGYTQTKDVKIPFGIGGTRFVLVTTDQDNHVAEHSGEGNNSGASDGMAIAIMIEPVARIAPHFIAPFPVSGQSGDPLFLQWVDTNVGDAPALCSGHDWVGIATDAQGSDADFFPVTVGQPRPLALGERDTLSLATRWPEVDAEGDYFLVIWAHTTNQCAEPAPYATRQVHIGPHQPADLVPGSVTSVPPTLQTGSPLTVRWNVANEGLGRTVAGTWKDEVYLSTDNTFETSDALLGSRTRFGALEPGMGYNDSLTVNLASALTGFYFVFVRSDVDDREEETGFESNNVALGSLQVQVIQVPPDLAARAPNISPTGASGKTISAAWSVRNVGAGTTAPGSWKDRIYLSTDNVFNESIETLLATRTHTGALAPTDSYRDSISVTLPNGLSGSFTVFVKTNADAAVFESGNGTNNLVQSPISINLTPPPDLRITSFITPSQPVEGTTVSVQWTAVNTGPAATGSNPWVDEIYLSADSTLQISTDVLLTSAQHESPLNANGSYSASRSVELPTGQAGPMFLLVVTDARNSVYEHSHEDNNVAMAPANVQSAASLQPDLVVTSATAAEDGAAGVTVSWRTQNNGANTQNNQTTWVDAVYLSEDATLETATDHFLGSVSHTGGVPEEGQYDQERTLSLPNGSNGAYTIFVLADQSGTVTESNESNNSRGVPVTVQLRPVDLRVTQVSAPTIALSGQPITVSWQINNTGSGVAHSANWVDNIYMSRDQVIDQADILLGNVPHMERLSPGAHYLGSLTTSIPLGLTGPFFVFVVTNARGGVYEYQAEGNNTAYDADPVTVTLPPPVDLVVSDIMAPSNVVAGGEVPLTWVITNISSNSVVGSWTDAAFLSADDSWDIHDPFLGQVSVSQSLAPRSQVVSTLTLTTEGFQRALDAVGPGVTPGAYFVVVRTDIGNNIRELSDANNTTITTAGTDFAVRDLPLHTTVVNELASGEEAFYRVVLSGNEDVRVRAGGTPSGDVYSLLLGRDSVPSRIHFDTSVQIQGTSTQVLPAFGAHELYLLIRGESLTDGARVELRVEPVPFGIEAVAPTQIGDNGQVTLTVAGSALRPGARVFLSGQEQYEAAVVFVDQSTTARARFFFTNAQHGVYDLIVESEPGDSAVLTQAIVIEPSTLMVVESHLDPPQPTRLGGIANLTGHVSNPANIDLPYVAVVVAIDDPGVSMVLSTPRDSYPRLDARTRELFAAAGISVDIPTSQHSPDKTLAGLYLRDLAPGASVPLLATVNGLHSGTSATTLISWAMTTQSFLDTLFMGAELQRRSLLENEEVVRSLSPDDIATVMSPEEWARWVLDNYQGTGLIDTTVTIGKAEVASLSPGGSVAARAHLRNPIPNIGGGECVITFQETLNDCQDTYSDCFKACLVATLPLAGILQSGLKKLTEELAEAAVGVVPGAGTAAGFVLCVHFGCSNPYDRCVAIESRTLSRCGSAIAQSITSVDPSDVAGCDGSYPGDCINVVASVDPNEKVGPTESSADPIIARSSPLPYTIYFQNLPTATAPAATVDIRDQLDLDVDIRKFRLTDFAWGDSQIVVPPNRSYYHTQVTLSDGNLLDIDAGVNASTREAHWTFRTLDPTTGQIPVDPLAGFLPPDDSTGVGQGHVGFTILADPMVPAGTEITNTASIVFDTNAPIVTNTVSNTLRDALADLAITNAVVGAGESAVLEGAPATVMATVTNAGEVAAPALDVRVFDGDPDAGGVLVGTAQLVNGLAVGATSEVGIPYLPSGVLGSRPLFAVVDRANTIREANEDNNTLPVTVAVSGRSYTVHYAAGVNMIAPPLAAIPGLKARDLAARLGASLVVSLDSTGTFTSFMPDVMSDDGYDIEGSQGYIVVTNAAGAATFDGVTHSGTVPVRSGVNMLSLPLDPGSRYHARSWCAALGATQAIRFDAVAQAFEPFVPLFHDGEGFELYGGDGCIAVTQEARTAVFQGTGWLGEGPLPSLAAVTEDGRGRVVTASLLQSSAEGHGLPVFGVAGRIYVGTEGQRADWAASVWQVDVVNRRTGATAQTRSKAATGEYGIALIDFTNQSGVRAGDKLQLVTRPLDGTGVPDTLTYQVTEEDLTRSYARLDASIDAAPSATLLYRSFPEPFTDRTHIRYQLARAGRVELRIFDVAGRLVRTLVDDESPKGYYEQSWSGDNQAGQRVVSGIYFLKFQAPGYTTTHRLTVLR